MMIQVIFTGLITLANLSGSNDGGWSAIAIHAPNHQAWLIELEGGCRPEGACKSDCKAKDYCKPEGDSQAQG